MEKKNNEATETSRCLTDGNNFLWAWASGDSTGFTRYSPNGAPGRILSAVEEAFDTDIVSEYQPEYWGYETQEEWDEAGAKRVEAEDARFYKELMKFVQGEEADIRPGTLGEEWAKNAKTLILANPQLALPENQAALLATARQDSGVASIFDERDAAAATMMVTHEDDLDEA